MDHPSADARDISRLLFEQLAALDEGTAAFQYARNTLVEAHMHLVRYAARRYRTLRNGQFEDVLQVGTIGLIKAIERFELAREVEFPAFALPYISGEIKRLFRDTTWSVQVPRRLKELRSAVEAGHEDLAARLDRSPTRAELARHLGLPREEVAEAEIAANGYNAGSLDAPLRNDSDSGGPAQAWSDILRDEDGRLEHVEDLHALAPLLAALDDRRRTVLELRYGQELTQAQIGARLGISQMHVSRILRSTLAELRAGMLC
ncbi:SigB/SigF/SigG family RNA polymerase sigma factor [Streptomyces rubiginosohelvolus]|uniref:SigB/SigF/SigG family RNA polymerase sigma factor n=1 Tax=Streptomyces TaxID=1883 RepID=UPI00190E4DE2|nr:SigB/SigF/SigG family RNA polymerase sigma factor [Streptomyces sp. MBT60]MBK3544281.1 SigB/SigF/SigG family RNA polymerase sigma factor [Streptomyces sp. MBT60]